MPSLKDLRNRIDSVKSTQKITKAMQMVAASKLRRAQEAAEAARPYNERMERVVGTLAANVAGQEGAPRLLSGSGSDQRHLIVVATAERGLCGGFNSSIARAAKAKIERLRLDGKDVQILCVGRKGRDALRREYGKLIIDTIELAGVRQIGFGEARPIARRLVEMFDDGQFDVCTVFFNTFKSVVTQIVTEQQIIPVAVPEDGGEAPDLGGAIYEYEPEEEEILADLLPRNVAVQIFKVLLENAASEQGARMSAMDNATRNAGDMIDKLTLQYNRSRQAVITKELIEIISGADAV